MPLCPLIKIVFPFLSTQCTISLSLSRAVESPEAPSRSLRDSFLPLSQDNTGTSRSSLLVAPTQNRVDDELNSDHSANLSDVAGHDSSSDESTIIRPRSSCCGRLCCCCPATETLQDCAWNTLCCEAGSQNYDNPGMCKSFWEEKTCCRSRCCRMLKFCFITLFAAKAATLGFLISTGNAHASEFVNVPYSARHKMLDNVVEPIESQFGITEMILKKLPPYRPGGIDVEEKLPNSKFLDQTWDAFFEKVNKEWELGLTPPSPTVSLPLISMVMNLSPARCSINQARVFPTLLHSLPTDFRKSILTLVEEMKSRDKLLHITTVWSELLPDATTFPNGFDREYVRSWPTYAGALGYAILDKIQEKLESNDLGVYRDGLENSQSLLKLVSRATTAERALMKSCSVISAEPNTGMVDGPWHCEGFVKGVKAAPESACSDAGASGFSYDWITKNAKTEILLANAVNNNLVLDPEDRYDREYVVNVIQAVALGVTRATMAMIYQRTIGDHKMREYIEEFKKGGLKTGKNFVVGSAITEGTLGRHPVKFLEPESDAAGIYEFKNPFSSLEYRFPDDPLPWAARVNKEYEDNKATIEAQILSKDLSFEGSLQNWISSANEMDSLLSTAITGDFEDVKESGPSTQTLVAGSLGDNESQTSVVDPETTFQHAVSKNHYTLADWKQNRYQALATADLLSQNSVKKQNFEILLQALIKHDCRNDVEETYMLDWLNERRDYIFEVALRGRGVDLTIYLREWLQAKEIGCSSARALEAAEWVMKHSLDTQKTIDPVMDREDAGLMPLETLPFGGEEESPVRN